MEAAIPAVSAGRQRLPEPWTVGASEVVFPHREPGISGFFTNRPSRARLAVLIGFIAAGASGCPSVRVVSQQDSCGVIAIPANTDMWPFRYRSKAEALLARQCPEGYVIEVEEEYVTGQTTNVQEDHQENEHQVSKRVSFSTGSSSTTATTSDQKEWRIHYRKKSADAVEGDESSKSPE